MSVPFMSIPPMPWARPKGIAATDKTRTAAMAKQYAFFMQVLPLLGGKNQIAPAVRGFVGQAYCRLRTASCGREATDFNLSGCCLRPSHHVPVRPPAITHIFQRRLFHQLRVLVEAILHRGFALCGE